MSRLDVDVGCRCWISMLDIDVGCRCWNCKVIELVEPANGNFMWSASKNTYELPMNVELRSLN